MTEKLYLTEAIVLSTTAYQEADAIVRFLAPEHGLVSAVARGARRPTSKRAGKLQPFAHVRVQLHRGRTLDTVVQVESIDLHPGILQSFERMLAAEAACELARKVIQENQSAPVFFRMLVGFLARVERDQPLAAMVRALAFELGSLGVIGFEPRILACAACGFPVAGHASIDIGRGGLICGSCGGGADESTAGVHDASIASVEMEAVATGSGELTGDEVKFLQVLFRSAGAFVAAPAPPAGGAGARRRSLRLDRKKLRLAFTFINTYLRDHLSIELASNRLLEEALFAALEREKQM